MIREMQKDVTIQVKQQGDMVDAIESDTSVTANNAAVAARDLAKASDYHKAANRKKWCIIGIIIVVLVVVAIVVAVSVTKK